MDHKKRKFKQAVTPVGTFKFPKLVEPDYGTKDYPNPNGAYSVRLVMPADDEMTKRFIASLQPEYAAALAEADEAFSKLKIETRKKLKSVTQNPLFTELFDKETEQPTGEIEFKFSMAASGVYGDKHPKKGQKWTAKPHLFDAKGNRMVNPPAIWGGTTGRVSFEMRPYFINGTGAAGLSLRLVGVQIIELRTAGERTADSLGFGAMDGGYEYSEPDPSEGAEQGLGDATTNTDDNSGDF